MGRLLYLNFTQSDISYAVNRLSHFMHRPCQIHLEGAMHILAYLKGTLYHGLFYDSRNASTIECYTDADYANFPDTKRSISGNCVFLGKNLVSWRSKKQSTVSRSSAEVEYRSIGSAVSELLWISYLLKDLSITIELPITIWCDNKVAIQITKNSIFHECTKHLEVDCHFLRHHFKAGFIKPVHVSTTHQVVDIFTKALPAPVFQRLVLKLN